ncbi:hypothetical protein SLEP1_g37771 [Rubroshorea leprosula]|uniref:Uncharacterized protein n=1 Tax=Rubroshorea leprosula TaxID=152421 RepID=A0AAV5KVP5_9ROSI|nr:hypothetical protein SLEP1_g37771 [Rubroshorea leprosula]
MEVELAFMTREFEGDNPDWRNGGWIWRNGSPGRPIEMVSPNWDESVELGGIEMEVEFGEMEVGEGRLNCLQD